MTWVGHYSWGLLTGLLQPIWTAGIQGQKKGVLNLSIKVFIIKTKVFFLEFVLATIFGRFSCGIKPRLLMSCHAQ